MRTTLDIPDDLMEEAREVLRFKSKTDVVVVALRELIRRRQIEELKELAGRVPISVDVAQSRRGRRRARS